MRGRPAEHPLASLVRHGLAIEAGTALLIAPRSARGDSVDGAYTIRCGLLMGLQQPFAVEFKAVVSATPVSDF